MGRLFIQIVWCQRLNAGHWCHFSCIISIKDLMKWKTLLTFISDNQSIPAWSDFHVVNNLKTLTSLNFRSFAITHRNSGFFLSLTTSSLLTRTKISHRSILNQVWLAFCLTRQALWKHLFSSHLSLSLQPLTFTVCSSLKATEMSELIDGYCNLFGYTNSSLIVNRLGKSTH